MNDLSVLPAASAADETPASAGSAGGRPITDGSGSGTGELVFEWWDACQLALVFVATQYIARGAFHLIVAPLHWPALSDFGSVVGQLAVAAFPIAYLFRLQPRAREILRARDADSDAIVVAFQLCVPLLCLLGFASARAPISYSLPVFDADIADGDRNAFNMIAACVAAPAVEEIFFRGILGRSLLLRYRPLAGVLLTSLLYAVSRLSLDRLAPAFALGLSCHFIYLATCSIYAPIVFRVVASSCGVVFLIGNDLRLALCALFAVCVIGFAVRERLVRSNADPFRGDAAGRQVGSPETAVRAKFAVLLAPVPFGLLAVYHLQRFIYH
jgi:membrane protease YdiL (CAAX protease family)